MSRNKDPECPQHICMRSKRWIKRPKTGLGLVCSKIPVGSPNRVWTLFLLSSYCNHDSPLPHYATSESSPRNSLLVWCLNEDMCVVRDKDRRFQGVEGGKKEATGRKSLVSTSVLSTLWVDLWTLRNAESFLASGVPPLWRSQRRVWGPAIVSGSSGSIESLYALHSLSLWKMMLDSFWPWRKCTKK